ncbi:unnamed protein product [Meloidogyne enterolobii]|uniref:Uncharacterized protein n=1 Tax=Meloidogyne enterolobii TaxID=390850 RepID=A0ACB0ZMU5_MELEN
MALCWHCPTSSTTICVMVGVITDLFSRGLAMLASRNDWNSSAKAMVMKNTLNFLSWLTSNEAARS